MNYRQWLIAVCCEGVRMPPPPPGMLPVRVPMMRPPMRPPPPAGFIPPPPAGRPPAPASIHYPSQDPSRMGSVQKPSKEAPATSSEWWATETASININCTVPCADHDSYAYLRQWLVVKFRAVKAFRLWNKLIIWHVGFWLPGPLLRELTLPHARSGVVMRPNSLVDLGAILIISLVTYVLFWEQACSNTRLKVVRATKHGSSFFCVLSCCSTFCHTCMFAFVVFDLVFLSQ